MNVHRTHTVIINKSGLHGRASAKLVRVSDIAYPEAIEEVRIGFCCRIDEPYSVPKFYGDARDVMDCMMLAASSDCILHIQASGECPIVANKFILELFAEGFGEWKDTESSRRIDQIPDRFLGAPKYLKMIDFVYDLIEHNENKSIFESNQDSF